MTAEQIRLAMENKLEYLMEVKPQLASDDQLYKAAALVLRDLMVEKRRAHRAKTTAERKKRIHYLSMEFLMGKSLKNSLYNLGLVEPFTEALTAFGTTPERLFACEPDPGLGNGGLGRLAACYLDGMATDGYYGTGYSILYEYGIFKQKLVNGAQTELPDYWLPGGEESMNGEEILPPTGTTVEDGDGNSYGIIRIGRQYWMDENLHTTKYNDGTAIAHITDGKEWMAAIEGAYCSYGNDDANAARYGLLYNRAAVSTHKLCPEGWHVPTVDDWNKLGSALGGTLNDFDSWVGIASKLKATAGWPAGEKATDESGFGGLPGGAFRADPNDTATAKFYYAETNGYWWSDSDFSGEMTYYYGLRTQGDNLDQYVGDRCSGMSVRCVHDF